MTLSCNDASYYSKVLNIFVTQTSCSTLFDILYCKALCKSVTNKYYYYSPSGQIIAKKAQG